MGKLIDLAGQKFGRLTVIKRDFEKEKTVSNKNAYWQCQCDCGKIASIRSTDLRQGKMVSCGCKKLESPYNTANLIGKIFGNLAVLERDFDKESTKTYSKSFWKCTCQCGNIISVAASDLINGHTQSCGCIKSREEEKIISILKEGNIDFIFQKTFEDCRFPETNRKARFDFYLPQYNILIEYDGKQHYETKNVGWDNPILLAELKKRDEYKTKWCKENNIPLIRILYTEFQKLNLEYLLNKIGGLK